MGGIVFTKILRWLVSGGIGITLMACEAYRVFPVEVLQPADFQIEAGEKIALLERNIRRRENIPEWMNDYVSFRREYLFEDFCNGVKETLANSGYTDSIVCLKELSETYWKESENPSPYPPDSILNLCQKYKVDYILSVELQYCDYPDYSHEIAGYWFIRLYDKKTATPVDSTQIIDTIEGEYFEGSEESEEMMRHLFREAGNASARRLTPHWLPVQRRIYTHGRVLRLGDYYLKRNQIEDAFDVWQGALQLSPKTALRAAINIGWLYENAGDFKQAETILSETLSWVKEKKIKGPEVRYLEKYLEIIREREDKVELLNLQLPPARQ